MNTAGPFIVHNRSRDAVLAENVRLADTPRSRRTGLLQHERLEADEGLWIYPTQAIHTFGMRFPIDVVFLDRSLRVKRIYHRLAPYRLTTFVWGAKSVLELASGSLASTGTRVGDELQFSPRTRSASAIARRLNAKRKRDSAQPQDAKRKRDSAQPQDTLSRMILRSFTVALLAILVLASGCVRRTSVQNFGLNAPSSVKSPDASLRAIFQQQTRGAFDPLTGDARVQALKNRIKANSEDTAAHLELGAVYESYRFYGDALEQYTRALQAGGVLAEQSILGVVRCDQALGRTWQAIPLLEQFVKEAPSATVWNALGLLYNGAGNLSAGESALREAVGANADSVQLHNNLGYTLLLENKMEGAEAEFRKELDVNPNSAAAHNNFGVLLVRRGDLEGALEQFEFTADEAVARNNLAVVLMELGKYEQSRDQLVKALAIRRNFGPALDNFKLVQEGIRERAESQKAGRLPQSNVRVASAEQEAGQAKDPEER